MILMIIR